MTSGTAILFWPHGGSREPTERIAPSYEAEPQPATLATSGNPALAPWVAHARYAPPGPALACLPTVRLVLPLFGATGTSQPPPRELPEALLDEPAVLQHIADLVEEEPAGHQAAELDEPEDRGALAEQDLRDDDDVATPHDWRPPEPHEAPLELPPPPPPYWGTTTDAARNAQLTDAQRHAVEPVELGEPEQPVLPTAEARAPDPVPQPGEQPKLLSWLDNCLRKRREQPPDQLAESAPDDGPLVEEAPPGRMPEPQPAAPVELTVTPEAVEPARESLVAVPAVTPAPVATPEPTGAPDVIEQVGESRAEPQLRMPEQPVLPQPSSEWPLVVEDPRPRRIEPRLPRRAHLPSLFTPSIQASPAPAPADPPRARRFAWRMRRQPPALPLTTPAPPAETPPRPVPAAPDPPPVVPVPEEPPVPAGSVPPETDPAPTALPPPAPRPAAQDDPALPARPAAYWAEPVWTKSTDTTPDQPESLAWTPPPQPLPGLPGGRRTTPAMEGLWEAEPVGRPDAGPAASTRSGRQMVRRVVTTGAGVVLLVAASGAVLHFLPRAFESNQGPAATFNAPMMVLRANGPGRVVGIAVQNGQTVEPNTLLLTIRTEPQPDPAASLLRARLQAAQARLSELDQALAQAAPTTDPSRARIADLRRQRASALIEVAQLQDGVTNIPAAKPIDLPVRAGVHGVIRSLEARNGTATAAGVPLVRMLDCDHAFLTVGPDEKFRVGQAVQVRLPNLPPVAATVRQSTGIAEPPDSLVIATSPGAFVGQLSGSCPIGATASVTPSITGS